MSALCLLLLKIFLEIFAAVIEFAVETCPPLFIFLLAACLFISNGYLSKLGGILLMIMGLILLMIMGFVA